MPSAAALFRTETSPNVPPCHPLWMVHGTEGGAGRERRGSLEARGPTCPAGSRCASLRRPVLAGRRDVRCGADAADRRGHQTRTTIVLFFRCANRWSEAGCSDYRARCADRYGTTAMTDYSPVYRRCGCTDPATGRRYGDNCPRLATDPGHGSWYFSVRLAVNASAGAGSVAQPPPSRPGRISSVRRRNPPTMPGSPSAPGWTSGLRRCRSGSGRPRLPPIPRTWSTCCVPPWAITGSAR